MENSRSLISSYAGTHARLSWLLSVYRSVACGGESGERQTRFPSFQDLNWSPVQTPKPLFHRSVRGNKLSPRAPFSKGIRNFLTAVSYNTTSLPRSPLRLRAQFFVAASPLVRTVILFVLGLLLAFGGVYLINNLKPEEGEGAGHRALEGAKSITSPAQVACSTWQGDVEECRGRG